MEMFKVIRVSGIATGVGVIQKLPLVQLSESICETLYDTGNPEKDAAQSEKWANIIADALNKHYTL